MKLQPLAYRKFLAIRHMLSARLERRLSLYYQGFAEYPWSWVDIKFAEYPWSWVDIADANIE